MAPRWEKRAQGRFSYELQDLAAIVGESLRIDEAALAKGALILDFDWPLADTSVQLRAYYPDSFPRTRPSVVLRDAAIYPKRHCSPSDGTLCLLGRDSRQWLASWTLATLLKTQLEDALNDTGNEDEQGEPAEYWWNMFGLQGSYCLVDSRWTLNGAQSGMLRLRYKFRPSPGAYTIQALVAEVQDEKNNSVCSWQGAVPPHLSDELSMPWVYLDETILPTAAPALQLQRFKGQLKTQPPVVALSAATSAKPFAILYRSELGHKNMGLGWLFALFLGSKNQFKSAKAGNGLQIKVIPTYRAGEADLGARVPSVSVLRGKRILVVGLGALGAPLALELARSGCRELHLLDHDTIEPGNSIRWPIGASAWGVKKTEALGSFIAQEYPWTKVHARLHAIGQLEGGDPTKGDDSVFDTVLPQVDLVVDATASQGVLNVLSDCCREQSLPLISLYASAPVHGGAVVRFAPGSGCPTCLEIAHHENTIERAPGFDDDSGLQQPPGCAERTFTGASFDLQELSLQAVRLAIETLDDPQGATGSLVQTLSLIDIEGRRIPPAWRVSALHKATGCSCNR